LCVQLSIALPPCMGTNRRFKLVTALGNSGHCSRALPLVDEALVLLGPQLVAATAAATAAAAAAAPAVAAVAAAAQAAAVVAATAAAARQAALAAAASALAAATAYLLVGRSRCAPDLAAALAAATAATTHSPRLAFAADHLRSLAALASDAQRATADLGFASASPSSASSASRVAAHPQGGGWDPARVRIAYAPDPQGGQAGTRSFTVAPPPRAPAASTLDRMAAAAASGSCSTGGTQAIYERTRLERGELLGQAGVKAALWV
jgi:hypothetical protein